LPGGWNGATVDAIWGTSDSDIYVVGTGQDASGRSRPVIYHWNGTVWSIATPSLPTTSWGNSYLYSVWGAATGEVYAVGHGYNGGTDETEPLLYRKTTNDWVASSYPQRWSVLPDILWISGFSANEVYAVGHGNKPLADYPAHFCRDRHGCAGSGDCPVQSEHSLAALPCTGPPPMMVPTRLIPTLVR
jgi:hypothetical protein